MVLTISCCLALLAPSSVTSCIELLADTDDTNFDCWRLTPPPPPLLQLPIDLGLSFISERIGLIKIDKCEWGSIYITFYIYITCIYVVWVSVMYLCMWPLYEIRFLCSLCGRFGKLDKTWQKSRLSSNYSSTRVFDSGSGIYFGLWNVNLFLLLYL